MAKEKTIPKPVAKCRICGKSITKQDVEDGKAYPINFPGDPFKFACNDHPGVVSMSSEAGYFKDVDVPPPYPSAGPRKAPQLILPDWVGGQYQWVKEVNETWKREQVFVG